MLIDQGKALLYFPKLKQVQEYFLGKNQDKAEFLLIGFGQSNQDIRKFYDAAIVGEEVINGQKTSILELKPKSTQVSALFTNIRLWLDQQRVDVAIGQRPARDVPPPPVGITLHPHDPLDGADQHLLGAGSGAVDRGSTMREGDRHRRPPFLPSQT